MNRRFASVSLAAFLFLCVSAVPHTLAQIQSASALPRLVRFGGVLRNPNGTPLTGVVGVTFALYSEQTGGAALWLETQNVTADSSGRYSVLLGSTKPEGLPSEMFTSEQARWIGVQVSGQAEQPRVLLVSAPYALKAGDAETLGGLPPSAFMLAAPAQDSSSSPSNANATQSSAPPPVGAVTGTGTVNTLPLWDTTSDIISSVITQTGNGATAKIGIGVAAPAAALDIKGGEYVRGTLTLPATANATATKGANSQADLMIASAFNSGTSTAVNQKFQLQAEPAGNDTATASGTLNLLYGSGTAAPAETGLKLNSLGQITFATGQTFPGTGTLTGITTAAGSGLAGGGTTGTLNLGLAACAVNQVLEFVSGAWACTNAAVGTITGVTAGTALTGGGTTGAVTLNLDMTKVPLLGAANTFVGSQTVTGNVTASGEVQGGVVNATNSFDIGGTPFAFGTLSPTYNSFVGFAGNSTMTGSQNVGAGAGSLIVDSSGSANTAVGFYTLPNTTGSDNTGLGANALFLNSTGTLNTAVGTLAARNTSGSLNTAVGGTALYYNATGSSNTALGYFAGPDLASVDLSNSTAVGANATVSKSNALVLGQTTAGTPGKTWVNVGVGTAVPASTLEAYVTNTTGLGPTLTLTNGGIGGNVSSSVDFNTYPPVYDSAYNPTARILAIDDGHFSSNLVFYANTSGGQNLGLRPTMSIFSSGLASLGTTGDYGDQLTVNQTITQAGTRSVLDAVGGYGYTAPSGSALGGGAGLYAQGGQGDPADANSRGGDGIDAYPGSGGTGGNGTSGNAGYFAGNVEVTGAITAGTKDFKIDHPLDPANKYLYHASVESSEMMNIYTGNVTTDAQGEARVELPNWFEAVNTDFRYQLTVIGQFAQAIVSSEVTNHQFSIRTDKPNVKVSWQITGVRQDAFAKAHPLVVEQPKDVRERGHYIHPELYGAPEELSVDFARHPGMMKKMQEVRAHQLLASQTQSTTERAETQPLAVPPSLVIAHQPTAPVAVVRPVTPQNKTAPRK